MQQYSTAYRINGQQYLKWVTTWANNEDEAKDITDKHVGYKHGGTSIRRYAGPLLERNPIPNLIPGKILSK